MSKKVYYEGAPEDKTSLCHETNEHNESAEKLEGNDMKPSLFPISAPLKKFERPALGEKKPAKMDNFKSVKDSFNNNDK